VSVGIATLAALAANTEANRVSVRAPGPVTIQSGLTAKTRLRIDIAEGFHLQANPASNRFLIPTEFEFEPAGDLMVTSFVYPKGRPHMLQGADSAISTYEGVIEVGVTIRAESSASAGVRELRGQLLYQACDSKRCFPPTSIPVVLHLRIVDRGRAHSLES
jgi:hypothetical protein